MDRQLVRSSNIHSVGYEVETQKLELEFHSGGVYQSLWCVGGDLPGPNESYLKGLLLPPKYQGPVSIHTGEITT